MSAFSGGGGSGRRRKVVRPYLEQRAVARIVLACAAHQFAQPLLALGPLQQGKELRAEIRLGYERLETLVHTRAQPLPQFVAAVRGQQCLVDVLDL